MCGIFGEFSDHLINKEEFIYLNDLNRYRGPDSTGYWSDESNCQLGFRRLAILDLSPAGNQPMVSDKGNFVITFNGEIYNYREIAKELNLDKNKLNSHSDTEVILNAFETWGVEKTAKKLNGMFAIALYHKPDRKIFLIRDFAGIKPLYYGCQDNTWVWGSQYDQVFKHPAFNRKNVDFNAFCDYLRLGYVQAPLAFYENTYQVQPGEIVEFSTKSPVKKYFYYQIEETPFQFEENEERTITEFDAVFKDTVEHQLNSDVPTGVFLSGGIDSPLVSYVAKKIDADVESFSIGSTDKRFDESQYIKNYAHAMQLKNHLYVYDEATLKAQLNKHFSAYSEPFGDYSSLPSYLLCARSRDFFTVALAGDGGDELFYGYPRFLNTVEHFDWFKESKLERRVKAGVQRKFGKKISYGIHYDTIGKWVLEQHSHNKQNVLEDLVPGYKNSNEMLSFYDMDKTFSSKQECLQWLRRNEFYAHMQRVLIKMDRASMAHSLEVRVPFLDKNIIEFAMKIKPALGIDHKVPKIVLKKSLSKKVGPQNINMNKIGFGVQMDNWLRNDLKEEVYDHLFASDALMRDAFDNTKLKAYINDFMKGNNDISWGVWIFFALQKWARAFE